MPNNQSNIYLSRHALAANLAHVRSHIKDSDTICACVKANAYGHGLALVAHELATLGVTWLAVHTLNEAATLRSSGYTDNILILGPLIQPSHWRAAWQLDARFFIYSQEQLTQYAAFCDHTTAMHPVHLKINTGLNRLGFTPDEIPAALSVIHTHKLNVEGVATHFATADAEPEHPLYATQRERWQRVVTDIQKELPLRFVHAANSSTVLKDLAPTVGTMHRPGMALYGYSPVVSLRNTVQPILTWRAPIVHIAHVPKGETVSYGATWTAPRLSTIAVLSVGYYDGLDRKLSNTGVVYVNDHACPIVGRVCMDMTMIDITDCADRIQLGDEAVIVDDTHTPAYRIAEQIDTIPYEVLARLNPLSINRHVVD